LDGRTYLVWWGKRAELEGVAGYACAVGGRLPGVAEDNALSIADLSQVADVYHDPAFQRVASFGSGGGDEVDLFRFDFRPAGARVR
jgi:hypothetical protein